MRLLHFEGTIWEIRREFIGTDECQYFELQKPFGPRMSPGNPLGPGTRIVLKARAVAENEAFKAKFRLPEGDVATLQLLANPRALR